MQKISRHKNIRAKWSKISNSDLKPDFFVLKLALFGFVFEWFVVRCSLLLVIVHTEVTTILAF